MLSIPSPNFVEIPSFPTPSLYVWRSALLRAAKETPVSVQTFPVPDLTFLNIQFIACVPTSPHLDIATCRQNKPQWRPFEYQDLPQQ